MIECEKALKNARLHTFIPSYLHTFARPDIQYKIGHSATIWDEWDDWVRDLAMKTHDCEAEIRICDCPIGASMRDGMGRLLGNRRSMQLSCAGASAAAKRDRFVPSSRFAADALPIRGG
jgi:hypothetical protein